eukprot:1159465-Pelagomonas_calceolata.AAC.1
MARAKGCGLGLIQMCSEGCLASWTAIDELLAHMRVHTHTHHLGAQLIMERKKELDAARAAESKKMLQGQPKVQEGAAGQAKVQQKSS